MPHPTNATNATNDALSPDCALPASPPCQPGDTLADHLLLCPAQGSCERAQQIARMTEDWLARAWARDPARRDEACLAAISSLLARAEWLGLDTITAMEVVIRRCGGEHLPVARFRLVLLDIGERVGRLPAKALLGLCRGLALGVLPPGPARQWPPALHEAACQVLADLDLPLTRRTAVVEALMLRPR